MTTEPTPGSLPGSPRLRGPTLLPLTSGRALLLMSGGHDSTALAAAYRPAGAVTIDYGQRPAGGEMRASRSVCQALGVPWHTLEIDLSPVGSGLLAPVNDQTSLHDPSPGKGDSAADHSTTANSTGSLAGTVPAAPSPEWWPFRNQLLVSLAAAWALQRGYDTVLVGSVAPDGERHADGKAEFYQRLDHVTAFQEGNIRVIAPAIALSTADLITESGVGDDVLAYAHSCHIADYACGRCPGCFKHDEVLAKLGRLQDD